MSTMARDGYLPAFFGRIDAARWTPRNAIVFCMAVSLSGPVLGREALGWFVDMSAVGASIGFGFTCLATRVTMARDGDGSPFLRATSLLGAAFYAARLGGSVGGTRTR